MALTLEQRARLIYDLRDTERAQRLIFALTQSELERANSGELRALIAENKVLIYDGETKTWTRWTDYCARYGLETDALHALEANEADA